jgi:hypothetical protein
MIETKDSVLFARPDGALVLFLKGVRAVHPKMPIRWDEACTPPNTVIGHRICYIAAISGERVACHACGLMVRVVAESRIPLRFICLDCEDRELAEGVPCAGNA